MTDTELNQWIHTHVMGECWHEFNGNLNNSPCTKCAPSLKSQLGYWNVCKPNYCSDLNAVAKAEAKVCVDRELEYGEMLMEIVISEGGMHDNPNLDNKHAARLAMATARQRAEAIHATLTTPA